MLDLLIRHSALLAVGLPLIGAAVMRSPFLRESSRCRLFAIMITGLTFAVLATAAVAYQLPNALGDGAIPAIQFREDIRWGHGLWPGGEERGSGLWLSVGFDGVSVWTACHVASIFLAVSLSGCWSGEFHPGRRGSWWLAWEGTLLLTILAQDLGLIIVASVFSVLLPALLTGMHGRLERRPAVERWVTEQSWALGLWIFAGGLLIAAYPWIKADFVTHRVAPTGSLAILMASIPELTQQNVVALNYWLNAMPWIGWPMLLAFLMRAGMWPFHSPMRDFHRESSIEVWPILVGAWLPVLMVNLLRLVCVMMPDYFLWLHFLAAFAVLWFGLLALNDLNWRDWLIHIHFAGNSLILCLATTGTLTALMGAWHVGHGWSLCGVALCLLLADSSSRDQSSGSLSRWPSFVQQPIAAFLISLSLLGFTIAPGIGLFPGFVLCWGELWKSGGNSFWIVLSGWLCIGASALPWMRKLLALEARSPSPRASASQPTSSATQDANDSEAGITRWGIRGTFTLGIVIGMQVIWLGASPKPFETFKACFKIWMPELKTPEALSVENSENEEPGVEKTREKVPTKPTPSEQAIPILDSPLQARPIGEEGRP